MNDWQTITHQILTATDIAGEYAAWGIDVTGAQPSPAGWLSCRCHGRDDRSPSAGINTTGDAATLGRYREHSGDCRSLSFFDAAVELGPFDDWQAARRHYAKLAGVQLPSVAEPKRPDAQLEWKDYSSPIVRLWCATKPGTTEPSVRAAGGKLAEYPKKSKEQSVICLPVYGPKLMDADPVNWWMWRADGKPVSLFQGKDKDRLEAKACGQAGMPAGWVGRHGLIHLEQAEVIWKTEGIPDLLALQAAIGEAGLAHKHVVITNSNGCGNVLDEAHLACLKGKRVNVIHDADEPGQKGAVKWCNAIFRAGAGAVRNVVLPYEVTKKKGKDVRDWLTEAA